MRALAVYASFAVNFIAVYILLQRYGPPVKTVIAFNLVYLAVGILQIVFTPEIVGAVVNVTASSQIRPTKTTTGKIINTEYTLKLMGSFTDKIMNTTPSSKDHN
jgi:hypothetical protein